MTIIGSNSLFVLIKVKSEKNTDEIKLEVSSSNFFSKEFNPADFKKNELKLIGVADQENLISKLNNYNNFQIKIALLAGIYAIIMFCLIRLTNMYVL